MKGAVPKRRMRAIGCRDTCDESALAGVIDAIDVVAKTTINNECNEESGETRPSEVRDYRLPVQTMKPSHHDCQSRHYPSRLSSTQVRKMHLCR